VRYLFKLDPPNDKQSTWNYGEIRLYGIITAILGFILGIGVGAFIEKYLF